LGAAEAAWFEMEARVHEEQARLNEVARQAEEALAREEQAHQAEGVRELPRAFEEQTWTEAPELELTGQIVLEAESEVEVAPVDDFESQGDGDIESARQRAQNDLAREMNEALLRAGAAPVDEWLEEERPAPPEPAPETILDPEAIALESAAGESELPEAQIDELPPEPVQAASTEPEGWSITPPQFYETQFMGPSPGAASSEADLWRIVQFDAAPAPATGSTSADSFEEALRRVDTNLEQLAGLQAPPAPAPIEQVIPEAVVETIELEPAGDDILTSARETSPPVELAGDDWLADGEDDLTEDPKDQAEAAKLRRQRMLRRALENMGALQRPGSSPTPAEPAATTAAPSPAPATAPSAPTTPDEATLAATIEAKFLSISGKRDHFAVLGLTQAAGREQVKAAFLALAKVFHPDRLPASLGHLAPKMSAVFEAVREAYELLYDDQRRRAYLLTLQTTSTEAAAADSRGEARAQEEFKKGEVFFRKRDFFTAEEHFARAYGLDPRAEFLAARAWALYMDPNRRSEIPRARQMMQDALKANPACDRAHYQLGVIARVENDMAAAERHFQEAVRANPRHLEANQELRLIKLRKEKEGKKGLFR
jgi:curved DNA-binding protein CbpA